MMNHGRRAAFTLAEATVATVIVAVVIVTALNAIGSVKKTEQTATQVAFGVRLAETMLEEILATAYLDPEVKVDTIGLDAGEDPGNRKSLDDVDDYNGLVDAPPASVAGDPIAGASDWSRSVEVNWTEVSDLTRRSVSATGSKSVTVTVRRGNAIVAVLVGLRVGAVPAYKE